MAPILTILEGSALEKPNKSKTVCLKYLTAYVYGSIAVIMRDFIRPANLSGSSLDSPTQHRLSMRPFDYSI